MPIRSVRTRFAPSPTGFLHLGNIRSALFPWAYARQHGGTFILRIEDTDVERSTPEAVQAILDAMAWLGLDYDEGPYLPDAADGPLSRGARRHARARARVSLLHDAGRARRAARRADGARRKAALRRALAPGERGRHDAARRASRRCIRFRNPHDGAVAWQDAVKGPIEIGNAELDDLVIARADGTPTYNFCVVVDDIDMRITHVIRGDDHVNNTPRQINIMRALGATPPVYAHLPTVLTPEGEKLSKRHGARGVLQYRDDGYLPEAIVNLPRAPGLGARRRRSIHARANSSAGSTSTGLSSVAGALRSRKAEMGQSRAPEAARPRRARRERLTPFLATARHRHGVGAFAIEDCGAPSRPFADAGRHGGGFTLLLRGAPAGSRDR